jgi:hypothetical protein
MNKFDQTILEYTGNLPPINPEEVAKRLAPALKAAPQIAKVMSGVGGAMNDASQKNPEEAMLIDKLKDPDSTFSSEDLAKLQKLMSDRGMEFKQQQTQETPNREEESETPQIDSQDQTKSIASSTTPKTTNRFGV